MSFVLNRGGFEHWVSIWILIPSETLTKNYMSLLGHHNWLARVFILCIVISNLGKLKYGSLWVSVRLVPLCYCFPLFIWHCWNHEYIGFWTCPIKFFCRCSWSLTIQMSLMSLFYGLKARTWEIISEVSGWSITFTWMLMLYMGIGAMEVSMTVLLLCSTSGRKEITSYGKSAPTVSLLIYEGGFSFVS